MPQACPEPAPEPRLSRRPAWLYIQPFGFPLVLALGLAQETGGLLLSMNVMDASGKSLLSLFIAVTS